MNQVPYRILWASLSEQPEQDCACAPDVPRIVVSTAALSETDCACPASGPEAALIPADTLWTLPPSLYRAPLPNGHELAFNPLAPSGIAVLNEHAARLLDSYTVPAPLADTPARQLAALGLLEPLRNTQPRNTQHASRFTPYVSRFTLWLHLTTRCNFRCAYCYAPRGQEDMSPEVGRAAVDGAIRSAVATGASALKIKYGGGEPTLNLPTLRAVHAYARQRAAEAGLELQEVLLTNGSTLTPALLCWLRDERIRVSISIDGIGSAHDRQRPLADEHPTSASVAAAVDTALALGLRPHLSVTVTARNLDGLADIVAFALERGLPFNLNFVRPASDPPDLLPDPQHLIASLQSAICNLQFAICNPQSAICNLLDRCDLSGPHRYPCGAGHSYLVVDPRGRVARCHMDISRTVGTVWDPDPMAKVRSAGDGFRNPPVEEKEDCRECLWRYVCAGGCPLTARRTAGREDRPSPYCTVYRAILPELLRLEGLRLLQQADNLCNAPQL